MKADNDGAAPSPQFACALLAVAVGFWWFAGEIPQSALSGKHDPGPRALPILLSCLLAVGGTVELIHAGVQRSADQPPASKPPVAGRNRAALILGGGLALYLTVIPQLGFYAATSVFVFVASWWLGARWWSAVLASVVMMTVVFLLFGVIFEVQL